MGPENSNSFWKAFLNNHVKDLVSIDFFTVPTVHFQVLFVFLVLAHHRRRMVHFNMTANPCSPWTAQQIVEAFPFDTGPRYLRSDGMPSTVPSSADECTAWVSKKCGPPHAHRGKTPTSSA